jgi:hypothetical protein
MQKSKIDFTTTTKKAHPNIWVFSTLISPRLVPFKDTFVFQLGFFLFSLLFKYQPPYSICWKCAVLTPKPKVINKKIFLKILQNARVCNSFTLKKFTKVGYCVSFFQPFCLIWVDSLPMDSMPLLWQNLPTDH